MIVEILIEFFGFKLNTKIQVSQRPSYELFLRWIRVEQLLAMMFYALRRRKTCWMHLPILFALSIRTF